MDSASWLETGEPQAAFRLGGTRGVVLLVCVAVLAGWSGHQALAFLILGLLALAGLARWWADHALDDVMATHRLDGNHAFPGDVLHVQLIAENRKALPLAWLRVRSAVPPPLAPSDQPRSWLGEERGGYLQASSALLWLSRACWDFEVVCRHRGVYHLGPLEIMAGDPFGFYTRRQLLPERCEIVVYPRVVPLRRLGFLEASDLGRDRSRCNLQDNPDYLAGVRDYRPGDSLRRIHWPATARRGQLQVRLFEPAAAPALMLVLACDTFDFPWTRYRHDLFELAASALASIAWRAQQDGLPVGLLTNGGQPCALPPASGDLQLRLLFDGLARAAPGGERSLSLCLADHLPGVRSTVHVLASGRSTPSLLAALDILQAARAPAVVLYADEPPSPATRVRSYRLREWGDLATTLEGAGGLRHVG